MLILIFIFLNLINYSILFNLTNDIHVRLRRSNFQCGKSFVQCSTNFELFNENLNVLESSTRNFIAGTKNTKFENGKILFIKIFYI